MSQIGSEWSRWDFHVHTPASYEQQYGDRNWDRYITDLEHLPPEVTVLGINDYFTVDGYEQLLEVKAGGRLPNIQLLLPVIELRIKRFAGQEEWQRINFSGQLRPPWCSELTKPRSAVRRGPQQLRGDLRATSAQDG